MSNSEDEKGIRVIPEIVVKEFIRLLKEEIPNAVFTCNGVELKEKIDKLTGDLK